jgi:hypothetical protein
MTRAELTERLAEVSDATYLRHSVKDLRRDPATLSPMVHPHDRERAEEVAELERLGVLKPYSD